MIDLERRECIQCHEVKLMPHFKSLWSENPKKRCNTCDPPLSREDWDARQAIYKKERLPKTKADYYEWMQTKSCIDCKRSENLAWWRVNGMESHIEQWIEKSAPTIKMIKRTCGVLKCICRTCKQHIRMPKEYRPPAEPIPPTPKEVDGMMKSPLEKKDPVGVAKEEMKYLKETLEELRFKVKELSGKYGALKKIGASARVCRGVQIALSNARAECAEFERLFNAAEAGVVDRIPDPASQVAH